MKSFKDLVADQIEEGLFDKLPTTKAGHEYMDKKREQRNAEHEKQDPKMAKMYAKNMVDTEKAAKKANERGIKKSASDFDWRVRNGVQRGKLPEETDLEEATVDTADIKKKEMISQKDKSTLGKVADLMAKEKAKKDNLPFTPDKPHKPIATAGKFGQGYSTARHLARMGMKDVQKEEAQPQEETTMSSMDRYLAAIDGKADFRDPLAEKKLTPAEMKKREEVAQAMERENPGMDKSKKMAIATATAKRVAEETPDQMQAMPKADDYCHTCNCKPCICTTNMNENMHYCAKHVYSERFGEGFVVEGSHAEPDAQGLIEWYDVDFGGTVRRVMTEKVKVMHAEYHMNHKKKMAKEEDEPTHPKTDKEKSLAKLAPPKDKITHADVMVGRGVKKEELSSKEKMKRGMYNEESDLEDIILEEDEVLAEGSIELGGDTHNTRRVPIKHYDEFKKTYPGSRVKFRGPKQGKDNTSKADATHFYIVDKKQVNKESTDLGEAMISYSDFKDKIALHRKAGNKVVDDKYNNGKATYTTIDKEGYGRKVTHTEKGQTHENLGKVNGDDDEAAEVQSTEKRGRGRPAGTKSGARRHN